MRSSGLLRRRIDVTTDGTTRAASCGRAMCSSDELQEHTMKVTFKSPVAITRCSITAQQLRVFRIDTDGPQSAQNDVETNKNDEDDAERQRRDEGHGAQARSNVCLMQVICEEETDEVHKDGDQGSDADDGPKWQLREGLVLLDGGIGRRQHETADDGETCERTSGFTRVLRLWNGSCRQYPTGHRRLCP